MAKAMLDAEGVGKFSMRRLAEALSVDPMALYHHFRNKAALIHAIIQTALEDFVVPDPSDDWREDVRALCGNVRTMAAAHPGAFRIYEYYDEWLPGDHRLTEAFHAALRRGGFSDAGTVRAARVLITYVENFAFDEVDGWLEEEDITEFRPSLEGGDYPTLLSLVDLLSTPEPDADFAFGIDVLIAGLEARLAAEKAATDRR